MSAYAYIGATVQTENSTMTSYGSSASGAHYFQTSVSQRRAASAAQKPNESKSTPQIRRDGSFVFDLRYHLHPRRRLDALFALHAIFSLVIGAAGYVRPSLATYLFFSTESDREFGVARAILRLYCSLIAAQGVMIWRARAINDGEIKRAFVSAYFACFFLSTVALVTEHMGNEGVVSGRFFGILKIVVMVALTIGYGWFTFFQPPTVFALRTHYH